jgi:hypothetical protein
MCSLEFSLCQFRKPQTPKTLKHRTPKSRTCLSTCSGGPTQLRHLLRSCDRGSRDRDFTGRNSLASQNPEPRFSDATCQHPMGRSNPLTPVSHSCYREIAIREFASPDAQGHSPCKTPNPDSSGSCATCPRSMIDGSRSIREIAGRDFKEVELLPPGNAERRTPILRDPAPRVPLRSTAQIDSGNRNSRFLEV